MSVWAWSAGTAPPPHPAPLSGSPGGVLLSQSARAYSGPNALRPGAGVGGGGGWAEPVHQSPVPGQGPPGSPSGIFYTHEDIGSCLQERCVYVVVRYIEEVDPGGVGGGPEL